MITVFHNKKFLDFMFLNDKIKEAAKNLTDTDLEKVAEVDTDSLEEAYRFTNHLEIPWQKNFKVSAFSLNARSTSVGDILIKDNHKYVIAMFGFEEFK